MKKLLVIIILNFFFFTQSQSDNIRDFQIENLGIGVSLLEYMTEDEIKDNQFFHPKLKEKDEYIHVNVIKAFETYDAVEVSIKKNDNKYIIEGISGSIVGKSDLEFKKQYKILVKELKNFFANTKVKSFEDNQKMNWDKSGETKYLRTAFYFPNSKYANITVTYITVGRLYKDQFTDSVGVNIDSDKINDYKLRAGY